MIAAGHKLSIRQSDVVLRGHAIEYGSMPKMPVTFTQPGLIEHFRGRPTCGWIRIFTKGYRSCNSIR